jgi:hypothetical protein
VTQLIIGGKKLVTNIQAKEINECRICEAKKLELIVDLGIQPLANALKKSPSKEGTYPLQLVMCKECSYLQLRYEVPQQELFDKYIWITGTSKMAQKEAVNWSKKIALLSIPHANKLAVEIASNDDTFLKPLSMAGFRTLGIDPAKNLEAFHTDNKINHEYLYFTDETADMIVKKYGKAEIVIARNVVAHVPNPKNFIQGVSKLLDDKGIAVIEFHYAGKILKELQYDSIYHEHISYFSLMTFQRIISKYNLNIFRVEEGPISGGSLIVYLKLDSNNLIEVEHSVQEFIIKELEEGINSSEQWHKFGANVVKHKDNLKQFFEMCKYNNEKIVFYGASARSSTLLNYTQMSLDWTLGFIDSNLLKNNLYTPGTNLLINSFEKFKSQHQYVDKIVITAWNFKEEILDRLKEYNSEVEIYVPLPHSLHKIY